MQPFADHERALRDAIVEVVEESFFAFTGPLDARGFGAFARGAPGDGAGGRGPWFATTVRFTGDLHGAIVAEVPEALAASLVGGFLGLDPQEPIAPDALRDGMGELANMICGTWLTRARRDGRFDLAPPAVERLPGVAPVRADTGAAATVYVAVNDLPLRLVVRGT